MYNCSKCSIIVYTRAVADGPLKVLPAECKYPPPPPTISSPSVIKRDVQDEMDDDLKDVVLPTVAEELASMVACSGDQLENVARNYNQGMDEAEMSYVLYQSYVFELNLPSCRKYATG